MGHDVFISHSSKDKAIADAVCAALEANGVRCWIAPRDIIPGESWASSILKGIASCRAMVLLFSTHANKSNQIRREVERAVHRNIPIAPVRIEDVMPEGDMEYFLSSQHWMDALTPPFEKHLRELALKMRALLAIAGDALPAAPNLTAAPPQDPPTLPVPVRPEGQDTGLGGSTSVAETTTLENSADTSDIEKALFRLKSMPGTLPRSSLRQEIIRRLSTGPLPAMVLQGLPGVGKSALLCDTARGMAGLFPHVFSLNLEGPAAVEPEYLIDELSSYLQSIGLKVDADRLRTRTPERSLEALAGVLGNMEVLVLLDPLDEVPGDWLKFILRTFASVPNVRLLAAARARPEKVAEWVQVFYVPPLEAAEAAALVEQLALASGSKVDGTALLQRLPSTIATHPAAIVTLMAQLQDFPLDMLLGPETQDRLPEAGSTTQLIRQLASKFGYPAVRALALLEVAGVIDVQAVFRALRLAPFPQLLTSLQTLLNRSLIYRSGPGYAVPPVAAGALAQLAIPAAEEVSRQLADAWKAAMEAMRAGVVTTPEVDISVLGTLGSRTTYYLWKRGRFNEVVDMARETWLEHLNLRGLWKEYSLMLKLGMEAAQKTGDRTAQVRLGLRLMRKSLQMGDAAVAASLLAQTTALVGSAGAPLEQAELHSHRAALHQSRREEDAALQELLASRRIRHSEGDKAGLATVEKLIGNVHLRRRDHASARHALESAIALTDRPDDKTAIEAQTSLALCDLADRVPAVAEKRLRDVLNACHAAHYEAGIPRALLNLALVVGNQGRPTEALKLATEAANRSVGLDPQIVKAAGIVAKQMALIVGAPIDQHKETQ